MPTSLVNGVRLFWQQSSNHGVPLVLVHGSWSDQRNWQAVVPGLSKSFRVVTYDRRGHSQSERPAAQGSLGEDADDLAALIRTLGMAPAHVVGHSFGGAVALCAATRHQDIFASLTAHEPPLFGLLSESDLITVRERHERVFALLRRADNRAAAELFVETISSGPGMWARLRPSMQETFVFNAPTFLDELQESLTLAMDLTGLAGFNCPTLLTRGTETPAMFGRVLDRVASALPGHLHHTFMGAGHVPQVTHPRQYIRVVRDFLVASGVRPSRAPDSGTSAP